MPISSASKYKGVERIGTTTPDEVNQATWVGATPADYGPFIHHGPNSGHSEDHNISIRWGDGFGNIVHSVIRNASSDLFEEDAYLLCLSREASQDIMHGLGKSVCLEIVDRELLISTLDEAVGENSVHGRVAWTTGPNRGHFLKSYLDRWQMEYRITWPGLHGPDLEVLLPPGIARLVDL